MSQPPRLRTLDLAKSYPTPDGPLAVLRRVNLELAAGGSVAILGPSGSGKSTLLNIIGGLEPPSTGSVLVDGEDPYSLTASALARFRNRKIGFVFQEHHLLPQCSALENVLIPTLAPAAAPAEGRARELMERVGLAPRAGHRPAELSGGERQRVALARALINSPSLVLADEPTGALDRRSAERVADLLLELARAESAALLVATHSEALAQRFDSRFELEDGELRPRK